MDIFRDSRLVIFLHFTIFITFSYKSLAGVLFKFLQSSRRQNTGSGVGFFAFDRCVTLAQWLVRWTVSVPALAGMLHRVLILGLIVPLSTQVYKWIPASLMLG